MELSQNGRNLPAEGYRAHRGLMLTTILCIGWNVPSSLLACAWLMWLYWSGSGRSSLMELLRWVMVFNGCVTIVGLAGSLLIKRSSRL